MQDKVSLRKKMQALRDDFIKDHPPEELSTGIFHQFKNIITSLAADLIVAGYWPVESEVDCRPCLEYCHRQHFTCCLPVINKKDLCLTFRAWKPMDDLEPCAFNIPAPTEDQSILIPTVILVPLLAFDKQGHRLGRGKGYYDATLDHLKGQGSITSIGLAYDCQEIDLIPVDSHDQRLDYVITPTRTLRFKG